MEGPKSESLDALLLVLTADDIGRILRLSRNATYNLLNTKGFPIVRCGRSIRIPKHLFLEWLASRAESK